MATRAPLPADSLLALAGLLSSGPGDGDEDSADVVRSAPGAVAGGGAPRPVCPNPPLSLRRRKAPRAAAPGRGVSGPGRLAAPRVSRRGREGGARLSLPARRLPEAAEAPLTAPSLPAAAPLPPEDGKAIWSAEEVPEGSAGDASWDPREQPEYVPAPQVEKRPSSEVQRSRRLAAAPPASLPSIAFLNEPGEGKPARPEPARSKPGLEGRGGSN